MNLLTHTILQEKRRIENMLEKYQDELQTLPRGTISSRTVGEKVYYYRKYRDGKKVVSDYVTKEKLESLQQQIARRRQIEAMMKSLLEEKAMADRALEGVL